MPVTVVIGAQWGDEGKGKIVDLLSKQQDIVVRYQGGANAGHTVCLDNQQFILHLIPSGILHPGVACVIGNGVVVDPEALLEEVALLEARHISVKGRLWLSQRAHLVMPYHKLLDQLGENLRGKQRIGTTGRGIGPAYVDKFNRRGIRIVDLQDPRLFEQKLRENLTETNAVLARVYGHGPLAAEGIHKAYLEFYRRMAPYLMDTTCFLNRAIGEGKRILLEGAQGTLLDVDHGTYPYVTSSHPTSGGACSGSGIGPTKIDRVIGVMKAYTTRVGEGPFPTELPGEAGTFLRRAGAEFGATTGRPRRCGWFDALIARYAVQVNGIDALAITKLDVLDTLDQIQVCVGYSYQGKTITDFPAEIPVLQKCQPVYRIVKGWQCSTQNAREWEDLPVRARDYLKLIEELAGAPVHMVSVGPKREQTLIR